MTDFNKLPKRGKNFIVTILVPNPPLVTISSFDLCSGSSVCSKTEIESSSSSSHTIGSELTGVFCIVQFFFNLAVNFSLNTSGALTTCNFFESASIKVAETYKKKIKIKVKLTSI